MPKKESQPRPLSFRLSPEAAERINKRINLGELNIFQNVSTDTSKLDRLWRIADEAMRILQEDGQSIEGCSSDEAVRYWLDRRTSKELSVFKALCRAVDENWIEVFDRCLYAEILIGEQKKALENFIGSFFNAFISSPDEKMLIPPKYDQFVEKILGSDQIDLDTLTSLIDTFIKEFALNGRKIRFQVISSSEACSISSIEIRGKNQKDKIETWNFRYTEPFPELVETEDWWWKGNISIQFEAINKGHKLSESCEVFISERGYIWAEILFDFDRGICTVK
ncbi:hypothetical protein H6F86_24415 [Phormidium sp. FACHB-592]|uniref:Uncharacterized protein n=1 Tax=Stenomitos frigidus AS-A4 TaxID=2933935 RepID=A0ABV0KKL7_9CYAN|nr:hypothetical protein [Phormidium sp. FACHB-592]MBD2076972.1 hypothetical protein [Phormidium sp. FACHB-592]